MLLKTNWYNAGAYGMLPISILFGFRGFSERRDWSCQPFALIYRLHTKTKFGQVSISPALFVGPECRQFRNQAFWIFLEVIGVALFHQIVVVASLTVKSMTLVKED